MQQYLYRLVGRTGGSHHRTYNVVNAHNAANCSSWKHGGLNFHVVRTQQTAMGVPGKGSFLFLTTMANCSDVALRVLLMTRQALLQHHKLHCLSKLNVHRG